MSGPPSPPSSPWLPSGKRAAVCFSIDDVHPGTSSDPYEAGGDLDRGALGHVAWLLERHPELKVTLFTTPDWRELSPRPTRRILACVPLLRDRVYLTKIRALGEMRLDRHPAFVAYLRRLPRTEIGLHGLHHIHRGRQVHVEFQDESVRECKRMLEKGLGIFRDAGIDVPRGLAPPGWNAPPALIEAMPQAGLAFLASARDIVTPIAPDALTHQSGLQGVSLIHPQWIAAGRVVHVSSNFQATSPIERATAIADAGGLVAIKGHIVKHAMGHVALDGMDTLYRNYLDMLFRELRHRYGDALWWTSMSEIADHMTKSRRETGSLTVAA
jgi:predicted deacetylase